MINFSLIRHGESEVNARPDEIGQKSDSQLTEIGIQQAKSLGKYFNYKNIKFDYVYSSTYDRALNTAKLALPNNEIYTVKDLREYDAGDWIGSSRKKVMTDSVKLNMGYLNNLYKPPGGESLNQVERRASKWLEDNFIYDNFFKNLDSVNVAIFSHGMTIKCLLHYVMGFDQNFTWRIKIDNTSVTKLSFDNEGWKLLGVNDCSHLG